MTTETHTHTAVLPVQLASPTRLMVLTVAGLLLALLLCLGGIIWLALAGVPAPDVLVGTTGTVVGALAGMLTVTVSRG